MLKQTRAVAAKASELHAENRHILAGNENRDSEACGRAFSREN
jgi:hypothetical protein